MQGPISDFNYTSLVGNIEKSASRKVFARTMKGIHSATITLKPIQFGKPADGYVYRKFYYNDNGNVVKKLSFNEEGAITMKEEYEYDSKNKILSTKIITDDCIIQENYTYDEKGNLEKYTYNNPKLPRGKIETNELDKTGRTMRKTNYGLSGLPELITQYTYPDTTSRNYTLMQVTKPDGALVMTFYFTYNKESQITGLYGFPLMPKNLMEVMDKKKENSQWEQESLFRSLWQYKDGVQTNYKRDEHVQKFHLELGYSSPDNRIITELSDSEYTKINGKNYMIKTTEWLTRYMEPLKQVKAYTYYDESGEQVYPLLPGEEKGTTRKISK